MKGQLEALKQQMLKTKEAQIIVSALFDGKKAPAKSDVQPAPEDGDYEYYDEEDYGSEYEYYDEEPEGHPAERR